MPDPPTSAAERDARAALEQRVREAGGWYHTIDLGHGVVTEGLFDIRPYVGRYGLPQDLSGKRVLEVGTFDGFWSFELERRGATVTCLDVDRIHDLDWPPRLRPAEDGTRGQTFAVAHEALGSGVERVALSVYDATPELLGGAFDIVFCGSVLIHLRDPMLALERMAALCTGQLVIAEEYSRKLAPFSFARGTEFKGESPWAIWWRPTVATWLAMVRVAGFEDVRKQGKFRLPFRARRESVPHVVIHASGPAS